MPEEDFFMDSDDDDDAPVEVTSKKAKETGPDMPLVASEEPSLSLFEQLQLKKQKEEDGRLEKKKAKKLRRKKTNKGQYVVQTKKAAFNVVTLDEGLTSALEPAINFKAELLKARTSGRRVRDAKNSIHRAKWVGRRKDDS
ncbi:unnamed protein product [Auanema sp. JU1783]|nr:unnamed protein product [Auanema sp. JU1783]